MTVEPNIDAFDFTPGRVLAGKYLVERFLGAGLEGEVYGVVETSTGVLRALKVFYPKENVGNRAVRFYAQKLERLKDCPILTHYHHTEIIRFKGVKVSCMVSELVNGELLTNFLQRQPGKRLPAFEALHLVYALARGLEQIHLRGEYHGDIHDENVLIKRHGVRFEVKLVDFYNRGRSSNARIQKDAYELVKLLYLLIGGSRHYARQPALIKAICTGMRRDRIAEQFPTAAALRQFLESHEWEKKPVKK